MCILPIDKCTQMWYNGPGADVCGARYFVKMGCCTIFTVNVCAFYHLVFIPKCAILNYRKGKVINMKEKLIRFWERKERYIEQADNLESKKIFCFQAFGGLEMAMDILDNWEQENELVDLWNNEWKHRLEEKVYEVR